MQVKNVKNVCLATQKNSAQDVFVHTELIFVLRNSKIQGLEDAGFLSRTLPPIL